MPNFRERSETFGPENRFPGASEHDEGGLLTPEEIIALKSELVEGDRISQLASWIVTDILTKAYDRDIELGDDPGIGYASSLPQEPIEKISQASFLGAHWAIGLLELCQLPEDEWEVDRTNPSSFAIWNEDMSLAEVVKEAEAITSLQP